MEEVYSIGDIMKNNRSHVGHDPYVIKRSVFLTILKDLLAIEAVNNCYALQASIHFIKRRLAVVSGCVYDLKTEVLYKSCCLVCARLSASSFIILWIHTYSVENHYWIPTLVRFILIYWCDVICKRAIVTKTNHFACMIITHNCKTQVWR